MANDAGWAPAPHRLVGVNDDMLQTVLELVSDGLWDWNANTGHVYRSTGWYEMLGYDPHMLKPTVNTWEQTIHPEDYSRVMEHFDAYLQGRSAVYQVEYRCRCRDGQYLWIEDRGKIVSRNPDLSVARMIGAHRSIHDRKTRLEQLQRNESLESVVAERTRELSALNEALRAKLEENRQLAETDALTAAANRYRLEQVLKLECERAQRFRQPLSIIAMDMDDFKQINDRHGHSVGDEALVRVVEVIRCCVRNVDLLARWGGDEFMLVLPGTQAEDAQGLARRIQGLIAAMPPMEQGTRVAMSFGVVQMRPLETQAAFLIRADRALYRAKAAGKNAISGWTAV